MKMDWKKVCKVLPEALEVSFLIFAGLFAVVLSFCVCIICPWILLIFMIIFIPSFIYEYKYGDNK